MLEWKRKATDQSSIRVEDTLAAFGIAHILFHKLAFSPFRYRPDVH